VQLTSSHLDGPHQGKDGGQGDATGAEGGKGVGVAVVVVPVLEVVVRLGLGLGLRGGGR